MGHPLSSHPLSSASESPARGWGAGSPVAGTSGHPSSPAPPPHAPSSPVPPNSLLRQGLPHFKGFGVQGAVSLLACAQVPPNPSIIYYGCGKGLFFLGTPRALHTAPPCLSLLLMCHPRGHGGAERAPSPQAAKGSGQQRHCPPFLPSPPL